MFLQPASSTSTDQVWVFLTATFLPGLIAAINRPHWTSFQKACTTILTIVAFAFFWVWYSSQWDAKNIATTLQTVIMTTVTMYQLVYKNLGWKEAIEKGVNPGVPAEATAEAQSSEAPGAEENHGSAHEPVGRS